MTDMHSEVRWDARRRMALWAFRMMCILAGVLLVYGLLVPGGVLVVQALSSLVITLFTAFVGVVGTYMTLDAVTAKKVQ